MQGGFSCEAKKAVLNRMVHCHWHAWHDRMPRVLWKISVPAILHTGSERGKGGEMGASGVGKKC